MDPRLVRGLMVLGALGMYAWMGGPPPTFEVLMQQLSIFMLGGAVMRRPGDSEPSSGELP